MLTRNFLLLSALGAIVILTGARAVAVHDRIVIRYGWILFQSDMQ